MKKFIAIAIVLCTTVITTSIEAGQWLPTAKDSDGNIISWSWYENGFAPFKPTSESSTHQGTYETLPDTSSWGTYPSNVYHYVSVTQRVTSNEKYVVWANTYSATALNTDDQENVRYRLYHALALVAYMNMAPSNNRTVFQLKDIPFIVKQTIENNVIINEEVTSADNANIAIPGLYDKFTNTYNMEYYNGNYIDTYNVNLYKFYFYDDVENYYHAYNNVIGSTTQPIPPHGSNEFVVSQRWNIKNEYWEFSSYENYLTLRDESTTSNEGLYKDRDNGGIDDYVEIIVDNTNIYDPADDVNESIDSDNDGIPDYLDDDDDNDGIPDIWDPDPLDPSNPPTDTDGDGTPDDDDDDDDNDGIPDDEDPDPKDPTNPSQPPTPPTDTDGDGTPDDEDDDDDNDGIPDDEDPDPLDPANPSQPPNPPFPPNPPKPPIDTDGDGTPDSEDDDDDNDGIPDDQDTDPLDPTNPSDPDGDPDNDGTPNDIDPDDDNDGVPDPLDPAPTNPSIPNNPNLPWDDDDDDDGVPNPFDPTPEGESSTEENDNTDSDGDGIPDNEDPAPTDPDNGATEGSYGESADWYPTTELKNSIQRLNDAITAKIGVDIAAAIRDAATNANNSKFGKFTIPLKGIWTDSTTQYVEIDVYKYANDEFFSVIRKLLTVLIFLTTVIIILTILRQY